MPRSPHAGSVRPSRRAEATVLLIVLGLAGPALGQAPGVAKAQAESKVVEARELFERGEQQSAIEKLEEAQALFPSPKLHFNFGVVYRSLGREVEALASFERFLGEAGDASPGRLAEAQRHVQELRGRVGFVEVASDTEGAEVFVDGRLHGRTPLAAPLPVAPGPHQVLVQKEGLPLPYTDRVEARAGALVRLQVRLAELAKVLAARPAVAVPGPMALTESAPAPPRTPVYRRWWFWTGVATVVAGAVTAGWAVSRPGPAPLCSDCTGGTITIPAP